MNLLAFVAVLCCMEPPLIFPPTGIYAKPEVVESTVVEQSSVGKAKIRYLTAPWCKYCVSFDKAKGVEKLQAAGYDVEKIDVEANPEWKKYVSSLPTFWLLHPVYGEPIQINKGAYTADQLVKAFDERLESVAESRELKETPGKQSLPFGVVGTSHESRATLIKHLLEDGIHKGKRTKSELEKMTDLQLDQLHHLDHVLAAKASRTTKPRR